MSVYSDLPPLPDDICEDLLEAPRDAQERMLRGEGWTEEQILAYLGPAPLSAEEEARIQAQKEAEKQKEERKAWWRSSWIPFVTLIVAFLTLLVSVLTLILR